jgi:hypothetical protein
VKNHNSKLLFYEATLKDQNPIGNSLAEVAIVLDAVAGAEITPTNMDMINNAATSTMAINSAATSTMAMVPQITIPVGQNSYRSFH